MNKKRTSILAKLAVAAALAGVLIVLFQMTFGIESVRNQVYWSFKQVFALEAESVSLILRGVDDKPTPAKTKRRFESVVSLCAFEMIRSLELVQADETGKTGETVCRVDEQAYTLAESPEIFQLSENEQKLVSEEKTELIQVSADSDTVRYSKLIISESTGKRYLLRINYSMALINGLIWNSFLSNNAINLVISLLLLAVLLIWMFRRIVFPLRRVSQTMSGLISGNTLHEERLPVKGSDEIANLSAGFNKMQDDLKNYVSQIDRMAKAEEAEKAQLEIAARIQRSLLESGKKVFPFAKAEFAMTPAHYVGGDFYDCFVLNDGKVCVLIADVSGKGVPAALFMAGALTAIRCTAMNEESPALILQNVNKQLCSHNQEMQFLTVFLAVWDPETGRLTYSNAGHNAPYLVGSGLTKLEEGRGGLMGVFDDEEYKDVVLTPESGSTLFLYTDGVNETVNERNEFFGTGRLEECLRAYASGQQNLIDGITDALSAFRKEAPQHDDVTMLTLFMEPGAVFSCPAETERFPEVRKWLLSFEKIPEPFRKKICLALEEIFVNICSYAYPEKKGDVRIGILFGEDRIELHITDKGIPYDPTKQVTAAEDYDPDFCTGGLGRLLVMSLIDEVHYVYRNHCNELTLAKKWTGDANK